MTKQRMEVRPYQAGSATDSGPEFGFGLYTGFNRSGNRCLILLLGLWEFSLGVFIPDRQRSWSYELAYPFRSWFQNLRAMAEGRTVYKHRRPFFWKAREPFVK